VIRCAFLWPSTKYQNRSLKYLRSLRWVGRLGSLGTQTRHLPSAPSASERAGLLSVAPGGEELCHMFATADKGEDVWVFSSADAIPVVLSAALRDKFQPQKTS